MSERGYGAHEHLVAPARAYPAIWRLFVGLLIVTAMVFGLNTALQIGLIAVAPEYWRPELASVNTQGRHPLSLLVLLASFVFVISGILVAVRQMHKRSLSSVIGPLPVVARQFWAVFRLLLGLGAVLLVLPPYGMGAPLVANLALGPWLLLLPLSLLAVLIQTSAEETLFRGYIQQALAARFSSPLVWMVLPSLLFLLGHYLPAEAGENALLIAAWSGLFGLLMADLTARAGTLGPAIAVHMFNNMIALLFISLPGGLSGLALYVMPFQMDDTEMIRGWLLVDFAMMFVSWLVARLAIRR
ncbi:MAG: membrane protease YdiL (CAAX protease family) [Paracoccaceae bacterium]|jgi:membrane protease YdiL (CAAX protease family)